MKNSPLDDRLKLLALADIDYLSARHLLNSSLLHTGVPKSADAVEKIFKLFLVVAGRINANELTYKNLKDYGHGIVKLFFRCA
jgi:hypothetical protein